MNINMFLKCYLCKGCMDFGSRSYRKRALIGRKHNTISVAKQCIRVTYVSHH